MANPITICIHCGEKISSGRYCKDCSTAQKRSEIDKENKDLEIKWKGKYGKTDSK